MLQALLLGKLDLYKKTIDDDSVQIAEKDAKTLSAWIEESPYLAPKTREKTAPIGLEQEIKQQVQKKTQAQIKVEIESNIEQQLQQYQTGKIDGVRQEQEMTLQDFKNLISEMKDSKKSMRVISLKDQLKKCNYRSDNQTYYFENCFSELIYGSEPYFYTCQTDGVPTLLQVFHRKQRPPSQILAVRHDKKMHWLLLSELEAKYAAKHLEKLYQDTEENISGVWLLQPDGSLFVKGKDFFPLDGEETVKGLLQINAFAGNVDFLNKTSNRKIAKEWLEENSLLKVHFLKLRTFNNPAQKRQLMSSDLIANALGDQNADENSSIKHPMCKLRRKRSMNT